MKNVMIFCFVAAILAVIASCSANADGAGDAICNDKDYERRLELAEYSLTGDDKNYSKSVKIVPNIRIM